MALSSTPLGTFRLESPDGVDTGTIAGAMCGLGQMLVVVAACTPGDVSNVEEPTSVVWNGHALTKRAASANSGSVGVTIWVLENTPTETGTITVTWPNPHGQIEGFASLVDGGGAAIVWDVGVLAAHLATGTTHTSTAMPATSKPDAFLIGGIAEVNTAPSGTIQAPFGAGQSISNLSADWWLSLREGNGLVAVSDTYTLQATGGGNVEYAAAAIAIVPASGGGGGEGNLKPSTLSPSRSLEIGI